MNRLPEDRPCIYCGKRRPDVEFYMGKGGHRRSECTTCGKEKSREWHRENLEESRARQRRWCKEHDENRKLKSNYGITVEDKIRLLARQENKCCICKNPFPNRPSAHVDHCHKTGKVRGLLCHSCNAGMGQLGDDPVRLLAALVYLCPGLSLVLAWVLRNVPLVPESGEETSAA